MSGGIGLSEALSLLPGGVQTDLYALNSVTFDDPATEAGVSRDVPKILRMCLQRMHFELNSKGNRLFLDFLDVQGDQKYLDFLHALRSYKSMTMIFELTDIRNAPHRHIRFEKVGMERMWQTFKDCNLVDPPFERVKSLRKFEFSFLNMYEFAVAK